MKTKANIRTKIKETARQAMIDPTEEFYQRAEEELEKGITVDFLEKIRAELIKKNKSQPAETPGPKS
jgi:hypothetical protein